MRTTQGASASVFQFQSHKVRIVTRNNEPWFVAADVCKALEIGNVTNALKRLDSDEQALYSIKGLSRGNDGANIINESGLYSLIFRSRKPEALKFTKWVTSEVLPAIRKTGQYSVPQKKQPRTDVRELIKDDFKMTVDMLSMLPDCVRRGLAYSELVKKTIDAYVTRLAMLLEKQN